MSALGFGGGHIDLWNLMKLEERLTVGTLGDCRKDVGSSERTVSHRRLLCRRTMSVNNALQPWVRFSFKELVFVQSSSCVLLVALARNSMAPLFPCFSLSPCVHSLSLLSSPPGPSVPLRPHRFHPRVNPCDLCPRGCCSLLLGPSLLPATPPSSVGSQASQQP